MPQSLQFNLASSTECRSLANFLKCNEPIRIEFIDPAHTPFPLVDLLVGLGVPYDIFAADAGLLGPQADHVLCSAIQEKGAPQVGNPVTVSADATLKTPADRWSRILDGARQILVPSPQARAFAAAALSRRMRNKIHRTYASQPRAPRRLGQTALPHLGLVPLHACHYEQQLMIGAARALGRLRPDIPITVIGATHNDFDLMRNSNAFVTGAISPDEFDLLADALGITCLFVSAVRPLFAHPILSVVFSSRIPIAYIDWSMGRNKVSKMDLAIHPNASLDDLIDRLNHWIPRHAAN
jgi:hypothetical protein